MLRSFPQIIEISSFSEKWKDLLSLGSHLSMASGHRNWIGCSLVSHSAHPASFICVTSRAFVFKWVCDFWIQLKISAAPTSRNLKVCYGAQRVGYSVWLPPHEINGTESPRGAVSLFQGFHRQNISPAWHFKIREVSRVIIGPVTIWVCCWHLMCLPWLSNLFASG